MVRNFMGMAIRPDIIPISVPDDDDDVIDAAPVRSLAMQWPYPSKAWAQYHEDKPRTGFDALASTGLVKITTTDAYESDYCSYFGVAQNCIVPENQSALHDNVTSYPTKKIDMHGHYPVNCQPMNPAQTVPMSGPIVGTTNLRNATKMPGAPAQLTLFYNGSVCVYDNISPEKAQAIMLLAGNCPPIVSSTPMTTPPAPVKPSIPKSSFLDNIVANQPYNTAVLCSSPKSITSIRLPRSVAYSETYSEANVPKAGEIHLYPNKVEVKLPTQTGTVPQFRRKSLARFLENRKDRVIYTASPFGSKISSDSSMGNMSSVATVDQSKYQLGYKEILRQN